MSRLKADLLLLLVAVIWGAAFVAQKNAFGHIGACSFIAARFLISAVLVSPFALREWRKTAKGRLYASCRDIALLCLVFCVGVIFQQEGLASTSVTNAGF